MVDREVRRHRAGRPGVGARDRGGIDGRDPGLAGTAGLRRRSDGITMHLELGRDVPLPRVEVVVPAGLEEVAVAQVHAAGQGQRDAVVDAALHLGLEPARVDHQPGVDGEDDLGDPRARSPPSRILRLTGLGPAVDLDQAGGRALVLLVDRDALRRARPASSGPTRPTSATLLEHRPHPVVLTNVQPELEGSRPIFAASWSITSSPATRTSGE